METEINSKNALDAQADKIMVGAFLMFYIFLAIIGYAFSIDDILGRTLLGAFFAHIFGGRDAGVGLCIAFDMNIFATILYNMFLEVLIVCFSYAFYLLSLNYYFNFKQLNKALKNAKRNALKYRLVISRYGLIGIFMFVMIPLPMTGPVVGSFIAHFLNFNLKKNFTAVFAGTLVAFFCGAFSLTF